MKTNHNAIAIAIKSQRGNLSLPSPAPVHAELFFVGRATDRAYAFRDSRGQVIVHATRADAICPQMGALGALCARLPGLASEQARAIQCAGNSATWPHTIAAMCAAAGWLVQHVAHDGTSDTYRFQQRTDAEAALKHEGVSRL